MEKEYFRKIPIYYLVSRVEENWKSSCTILHEDKQNVTR